ncbi:hypothetical protein BDP27DRAFT_490250 [Rhodocollybia butyracea]|uniref:Uncharacterized protein n=1 Tax=Rhodocollybia butyracea TaxID=206335 RepID=A0A9P5QAP8_9AGAR|nr:hypothetical protein BDP27DRAFT_490250 [Rhodocollybia butyracea]
MSFFEHSYDFEVIGGNFYAVTGDVNFIEKASSCSSSSVQRSEVQKSRPGGPRYTPYSVSTRPQGRLTSHACSRLLEKPAGGSSNSGTLITSDTLKVTTFDGTRFSQCLPQPQLSGTTVSLYPSLIIDSDAHPLHAIPYTLPTLNFFRRSEKPMIFPVNAQRSIQSAQIDIYLPAPTGLQPLSMIAHL